MTVQGLFIFPDRYKLLKVFLLQLLYWRLFFVVRVIVIIIRHLIEHERLIIIALLLLYLTLVLALGTLLDTLFFGGYFLPALLTLALSFLGIVLHDTHGLPNICFCIDTCQIHLRLPNKATYLQPAPRPVPQPVLAAAR